MLVCKLASETSILTLPLPRLYKPALIMFLVWAEDTGQNSPCWLKICQLLGKICCWRWIPLNAGKRSGGPHAIYIYTDACMYKHTYIYIYTLVRTSHSVGLFQSAQRGWFAPLLERKKQLRYLWAKGAGSAAGQATGLPKMHMFFGEIPVYPTVSPFVDDFLTTCPIALMIKSPSVLSP